MIYIDEYTRDYINKLSDLNNIKESLDRCQKELEDTITNYEAIKINAKNLERVAAVDLLDSKLKTLHSLHNQVVSDLDSVSSEIKKVQYDLKNAELNRDLDDFMKNAESKIMDLTEKYKKIQHGLSEVKSKRA